MAAQRPDNSDSCPALRVASRNCVSVESNASEAVSKFTWVDHARSVGVGVGAAAEASVQNNGVESAMIWIEPEVGVPPPSPGFNVARTTSNCSSPLAEIGQLQHSVSS